MALATIDDVKRVLGLTTTTSTQNQAMQAWLDTAESYARPYLQDFEDSAGTATFYNVTAPALLDLPTRNATVVAVRGFIDTSTTARVFAVTEYTTSDRGLELEFDGEYERVEVDWEYAEGVPEAVRDGVAMFAAYLMTRSASTTTGIKSERIGDYSYTIADAKLTKNGIPIDIWTLMKPYRRRRLVLTTP